MKKLEIDETFARQLYPTAGNDLKQALINTFGREFFEEKQTDPLIEEYRKISSYEAACEYEGIDPAENLPYNVPSTPRHHRLNNMCILETAYEAINKADNFVVDYNDSAQEKWYAWVEYDPKSSGFVFSYSNYVSWHTHSTVGARLCVFRNVQIANFFAETFLPVVNKIYFGENNQS